MHYYYGDMFDTLLPSDH